MNQGFPAFLLFRIILAYYKYFSYFRILCNTKCIKMKHEKDDTILMPQSELLWGIFLLNPSLALDLSYPDSLTDINLVRVANSAKTCNLLICGAVLRCNSRQRISTFYCVIYSGCSTAIHNFLHFIISGT